MLENISAALTGFLQRNNNPLGLALLGASALVEYVFPPFPGDTVTLFGAFLVVQHDWSLAAVFASVLFGSAIGAMIDFQVGIWIRKPYDERRIFKGPTVRAQVDRAIAAFQKHGEAYVAINRFLPAVRAMIFVAAGMSGLRAGRVLLFAVISAAAWNALIVGAGFGLGANWNRIRTLFRAYGLVAWGVIAAVALFFFGRWVVHRRRRPKPDERPDDTGGPV